MNCLIKSLTEAVPQKESDAGAPLSNLLIYGEIKQ